MTPEIRRRLSTSPYLDQLLALEHDAWAALMDMVEETEDPTQTWIEIADELAGAAVDALVNSLMKWSDSANAPRIEISYFLMFQGLAQISYPYTVHLLPRLRGIVDVRDIRAAIDGMNTASCGKNWEEDLEREQIEEVLSEQGNLEAKPLTYREATPVEPEEGEGMSRGRARQEIERGARAVEVGDGEFITVSDERHHRWWLSYAPEWLEWELKQEHDEDGEFLTLISHGGGYMSAEPEYLIIDGGGEEDEIWKKVAEPAHGAEKECIYVNWDPDLRDSPTDPRVKLEHTFCGENPGRECRYCGADIGEKHGFIYIGEGAETVYLRLRDEEPEED